MREDADYAAAKTGDSDCAYRLARRFLNPEVLKAMDRHCGTLQPILLSAHAVEREGVNAIPEALAEILSIELGWSADFDVVQTNIVSHTKADGFSRLARQAEFAGSIEEDRAYFLVDDFIGQGGTLANLRGWVLRHGGHVKGATVLTAKEYSATVSIDESQIHELKNKHGRHLEKWWTDRFGFGYECLTRSEGRYLINTPSADRIRDRIIAAVEDGNSAASP